jgi:hypothetical protein
MYAQYEFDMNRVPQDLTSSRKAEIGGETRIDSETRIPRLTRACVTAPRRGEAQSRRCRSLSALVGMPDVTGLKPGHRSTRGLHYTPMVPLGARRGRQPDPLAGGLLARGGSVAA